MHHYLGPDCVVVTNQGRVLLYDSPYLAALPPSLQRAAFADNQPASPLHALNGTVAPAPASLLASTCVAPEVRAGHPATPFSDLWAFGCLAWLLTTGKEVRVENGQATMPGAFLARFRGVPLAVQEAIKSCLDIDPMLRPRRATELVAVVDAWGPTGRKRLHRRRLRVTLAVIAILAVVSAAVIASSPELRAMIGG